MNKRKMFFYISILLAEGIAVFYDTQVYKLRLEATQRFEVLMPMFYSLFPLFLVGLLLAVGLNFMNDSKPLGFFIGIIGFNMVLLLAGFVIPFKYNPFILYDLRGIALMLGVSIGGIILVFIRH